MSVGNEVWGDEDLASLPGRDPLHSPLDTENQSHMLSSYLRTAIRAMRRHVGYALINVVGLGVGIAVCLLITLFVQHELQYDRFHENADQIYRITSDWGDMEMPATTLPAVRTITENNPSLTIALFLQSQAVVGQENRRFDEQIFVARPPFLDVFTFPAQRGDARQALTRPYTAAVTPEIAEKYFGADDPIGQTIEVSGVYGTSQTLDVTIESVLEPIPEASHFRPQILLSWETLNAAFDFDETLGDSWGNNSFRAYLQIPEGASPDALAERFTEQGKARAGNFWNGATLKLQPLTSIHLSSNMDQELEANGSLTYVYLFAAVALFVLVLACVNFVNLATARATERAREVGVRKTVGALRRQIAGQFLAEAFVLSVGGLVLALGLASAALPLFQSLTGIEFGTGALLSPFALTALVVIAVVAAVGAGGYPAFVLSRFDPAVVLGGSSRGGSSSGGSPTLRKGLVVFQFATAVVLIAGTIVAYGQLDYLQSARLGFDQEQVVTLPMPPAPESAIRAFETSLAQRPGIVSVSQASEPLPSELLSGNSFAIDGLGLPEDDRHPLRVVAVDFGFFETLGVKPLAGRTFERSRGTDSSAVVLNRAAQQLLTSDLPSGQRSLRDVIDRQLVGSGGWPVPNPRVIGVVEDFHLATLREQMSPVAFFVYPGMLDTYYARIEANRTGAALADLEQTWQQFFDVPLDVAFADQSFASAYRAEQQLGTLFSVFSGLAVFVAVLGLFGLAAFTAKQRTKEIGIRKALGASVSQIVGLLSKEFAALVLGAIVVALPIAYVALSRWLGTFAYHIDLGVGVFLLAGGTALAVALVTVGTQALRAAQVDPARVLRSE